MIGIVFSMVVAALVAQASGEAEQLGPGVVGAYGGIVAQSSPAVYYNATLTMAPTGQGQAAFFNPALGFKCLGLVKFFQGTSYTYNLQVDHSNTAGACSLYGSFIITPGLGYAQMSFFPQSSTVPAFTATLMQWV